MRWDLKRLVANMGSAFHSLFHRMRQTGHPVRNRNRSVGAMDRTLRLLVRRARQAKHPIEDQGHSSHFLGCWDSGTDHPAGVQILMTCRATAFLAHRNDFPGGEISRTSSAEYASSTEIEIPGERSRFMCSRQTKRWMVSDCTFLLRDIFLCFYRNVTF